MKNSKLCSADMQIGSNPGFGVIEIYDNRTSVVIERYYPTLSDVEVDVAVHQGQEEILHVYNDYGDYYDSINKDERISR